MASEKRLLDRRSVGVLEKTAELDIPQHLFRVYQRRQNQHKWQMRMIELLFRVQLPEPTPAQTRGRGPVWLNYVFKCPYNVLSMAELSLHGVWVISFLPRSKWPANHRMITMMMKMMTTITTNIFLLKTIITNIY